MTRLAAYDASEWSDLFVATAGASAALAGLVFVAVSINVDRILKLPGIPERALETVLLLLSVVLVSIVGLIPGQDAAALGAELVGLGVILGVAIAALAARTVVDSHQSHAQLVSRLVLLACGTLPVLIGGVSLLAEAGGGLYWASRASPLRSPAASATPGCSSSRSCADPRICDAAHRRAASRQHPARSTYPQCP